MKELIEFVFVNRFAKYIVFHIIIKENARLLDGTSAENFHKICFSLCKVFISFIRSWVQSNIKSFFDFSLITSFNLSISLSLVISKKFSLLTLCLTLEPFFTISFSTESLRSLLLPYFVTSTFISPFLPLFFQFYFVAFISYCISRIRWTYLVNFDWSFFYDINFLF